MSVAPGIPTVGYWQISYRVGLSLLLGGAVGLQRELESHPAGLRTHSLVCLGSTLLVILSAYGFEDFTGSGANVDPTRIAAQIVSGIGFLGGGAILKTGLTIQGLTTAATLWVTSAIGMCCGVFFWYPAVLTTAVVIFVLETYKRLERLYWGRVNRHEIRVENLDDPTIGKIFNLFGQNGILVKRIVREVLDGQKNKQSVTFVVQLPKLLRKTPQLMINLIRGVESIAEGSNVFADDRSKNQWRDAIQKRLIQTKHKLKSRVKKHFKTDKEREEPQVIPESDTTNMDVLPNLQGNPSISQSDEVVLPDDLRDSLENFFGQNFVKSAGDMGKKAKKKDSMSSVEKQLRSQQERIQQQEKDLNQLQQRLQREDQNQSSEQVAGEQVNDNLARQTNQDQLNTEPQRSILEFNTTPNRPNVNLNTLLNQEFRLHSNVTETKE